MDAATTDAPALVTGLVLEGKYRVGKALGGGAMGIVYEAYHLRLQKAVAIKVLRPELAALEDVRDRFEAEARAAAAIGHPNIVSVTDLGQTPEGALYFVMDRLRGETLGERLERVSKLDIAGMAAISKEVLSGLASAHELRLVHRDLKPDNIFLARPPGGRELAKILDFGVAKALASVGRRLKGTRVGTTVGTPLYMAPEQAMADPDIDARADLYAMGVIIYQMLAGRPPFEGKDAVAVLTAVMTESPPPLEVLCPSAPIALLHLIESAMNRDRDKRPASATAFAEALDQAVAGLVPSGPISRPLSVDAAFDAAGMAALNAAVLVDLAGSEPAAAGPGGQGDEGDPEPAPQDHVLDLAPAAAPTRKAGAETYVIPPEERRPSIAAADSADAGRPARHVVRRLLPILVAALAAVLLVGKLKGSPEAPAPTTTSPHVLTATLDRPTSLVQFDVGTQEAQLFLDGSPLASNPVALRRGELHTIMAVSSGRVIGTEKFRVEAGENKVRIRVGVSRNDVRR